MASGAQGIEVVAEFRVKLKDHVEALNSVCVIFTGECTSENVLRCSIERCGADPNAGILTPGHQRKNVGQDVNQITRTVEPAPYCSGQQDLRPHPRTHKGAVLIAAYVMFACVAVLLSVNLTSPASSALGADWQWSRFALVFTSCTPVRAHETVFTGVRKRA